MREKKPTWVKHLKEWGMRPLDLAKRLDCPVDIVVRAYKGDEDAFYSLLDGADSRSNKKMYHPSLTGPMELISKDRRKRPKWMGKNTHSEVTNVLKSENPSKRLNFVIDERIEGGILRFYGTEEELRIRLEKEYSSKVKRVK